jgi:quinol monooxygenase YgiN
MNTHSFGRTLGLLGVVALVGTAAALSRSQDRPDSPPKAPPEALIQMPDLVSGLRKTPGCLGVDAARTMSGKNTIFAWFQDKKAVLAWYHSEMHQQAMDAFMDQGEPRAPMTHIDDDSGPIMVIASITPADAPVLEGVRLPVSAISIELYAPLPGGAYVGGRFAPQAIEVPHMRGYPGRSDRATERPSD